MNTYWTEAAQLYLILHQSCFSLKSDHQDLLRSFTFTVPQRRNDLHLTSSEEPLFLHFSFSIGLHYMFGSFTSHLTKTYCIIEDIERWLIFRSFYVSICIFQYLNCCKDLNRIEISASAANSYFCSDWVSE